MTELIVLLRGSGTEVDRRRTIEALQKNTADFDVCYCGPTADDTRAVLDAVSARARRVCVVGAPEMNGAVEDALVWSILQSAPEADIVLLEIGTAVGPRWHELLRDAASGDATYATASAVPADLLTLEDESREYETPRSAYGAALGEPLWGCVYLRRDALNVARNMRWRADYGQDRRRLEELVLVPGMVHILSTAVVQSRERAKSRKQRSITAAMRRTIAEIEAAVEPLRVTVDMRCCGFPLSGTQVHALSLVSALAKRDDVRLSILLPPRPDDSVRPHLDAVPPSVKRHTGRPIAPPPHVFHRPYQVLSENEITDVVTSGARLVVTHQDMILDRTPAYFASKDQWRHYTATTAVTLVAADEVVFFSEHARQEAVHDGLVDLSKTSVVPPGTDHLDDRADETMPRKLAPLPVAEKQQFLLVFGNAYTHKNRLFALRVAEELRQAHGWNGWTVFVGGQPGVGSSLSLGEESAFLRDHESLNSTFVDVPPVTDAERHWLYSNAALVLFPTLYEGFGLIPFEAAAAGTPCVYSSRSSVAEFLPPEGAVLDLGDVAGTANRVRAVLESNEARDQIVQAIRHAGSELTWARAASAYVDVYRRSMTRPVGLPIVSGREVIVGARSQMASSETERRILLIFRRSPVMRLAATAFVALALRVRRVARRFSRIPAS